MTDIKNLKKFYNDTVAVIVLSSVVAVCAFSYFYFTVQTVAQAVDKRGLHEEVTELKNEISSLEYAYLNRANSLNLETAKELGLTNRVAANYVDRPSLSQAR